MNTRAETASHDRRDRAPLEVVVSWRRSRPQLRAAARRLSDAVADRLGGDHAVIGAGFDEADAAPDWAVRRAAERAALIVAIIDADWSEAMDDRFGPLSADDARTRLELGAALVAGAPVILATTDLAAPPRRDQLSPELARLSAAPVAPLRDACLDADAAALADRVARTLAPSVAAPVELVTPRRRGDPAEQDAAADRAWRALGPAPTAEQVQTYIEIYGAASRPRAGRRWRLVVAWLLFAATTLAIAVEVMTSPPAQQGSRENR